MKPLTKPLVIVIACATLLQVVIVAGLEHEKRMWRDAAESCGKPTVRDAIEQFAMRTLAFNGRGYDNIALGRAAVDQVVGDAMGAAHIAVIRIAADGHFDCIGPHACDAVVAESIESTCAEIVAKQKLQHPDVEVRCTDARGTKAQGVK